MGDRSIRINGELRKPESGVWVKITGTAKREISKFFLLRLKSELMGLKMNNIFIKLKRIKEEMKFDKVFIPYINIEGVYFSNEQVKNDKNSRGFTVFLADEENTEAELFAEHLDHDALEKEYQDFIKGKKDIEP